MRISFYSDRMKFNGSDLEKVGLGGSESALINLSNALLRIDKTLDITVYNGSDRLTNEIYNGIKYKSILDFNFDCKHFNMDVFISLRGQLPFLKSYVDSKVKCFWSEDDMEENALIDLSNRLYGKTNVDLFLCVSNHSINSIKTAFPDNNMLLLRNGYNEEWVVKKKKDLKNPVCIYTSTPFRGLDVLSEIWPYIFKGCLDKGYNPSLRVFGDMSLYKVQDNFNGLYNIINNLPNSKHFGSRPQKDLYNEYSISKVMLYPNHFRETSCMAVLEALANDCWVVTTNLGALSEQVIDNRNGFLVSGDAHTLDYKKEFIFKSIDSICNPYIPDSSGLIFSWENQAKLLLNKLKGMI